VSGECGAEHAQKAGFIVKVVNGMVSVGMLG